MTKNHYLKRLLRMLLNGSNKTPMPTVKNSKRNKKILKLSSTQLSQRSTKLEEVKVCQEVWAVCQEVSQVLVDSKVDQLVETLVPRSTKSIKHSLNK